MLAAHSDEVGFIVKAVEPTGFLRFDRVGGTPENMLLGQRVLVAGHRGVIGVKSAHLQRAEEGGKPVATQDMYIEVGARSAEEVEQLWDHRRVGHPPDPRRHPGRRHRPAAPLLALPAEAADLNDGVGALKILQAFIKAMPGHADRLKFLAD